MKFPPVQFEPILREYLWGGRQLAALGKPIGHGSHYAESWEVVDHGGDQSVVANGSLAGTTLHELATQHGRELFGRHFPQRQFPLLFKYLDCQRTLSVQVHPNDEQAAMLTPPDWGKTEAWVVLAAAPGSKIFAGLKSGVDRRVLEEAVTRGAVEGCLHEFEPQVGDCLLIAAGTVHALGAGLLVAEIQQSSDTTYRLFDWNRVDAGGRPRALHVQQALETTDYARGPVTPSRPAETRRPHVERLVRCDKFVLDRWRLANEENWTGDDRFHVFSVIEGAARFTSKAGGFRLSRGDTMLVPACCTELTIAPEAEAVLLDMYLP